MLKTAAACLSLHFLPVIHNCMGSSPVSQLMPSTTQTDVSLIWSALRMLSDSNYAGLPFPLCQCQCSPFHWCNTRSNTLWICTYRCFHLFHMNRHSDSSFASMVSPEREISTACLQRNCASAVTMYVLLRSLVTVHMLLRSQADAGRDFATALASLQTRWCHSVLRHSDSLDRHGHPL